MPDNPSIFKAYDIRGVYPTELDEDLAVRLGRAVVSHLRVPTVAVGWDVRTSGPALVSALERGITMQGADVVELGTCSTDAFYFAICHFGFAAGVMVTASHNPPRYNGFKIVGALAEPVAEASGLRALQTAVAGGNFPVAARRGTVRQEPGVIAAFAAAVRSAVDLTHITPLKVVMDAGNGVGGLVAPAVFAGLPLDVTALCFTPDGTFPNHPANPLLPENRRDLEAAVRQQQADVGIAWDADADRCFFVDETGTFVPGDFVTARLAADVLDRSRGGAVVYDLRASRCVPDTVRQHGGTPVVSRVGHAFIKAKMREHDAVFGGEVTGHYYYQFAGSFLDNGFLPALQMLAILSRRGGRLSQLFADYRVRYHISGERNYVVPDPDAALGLLEARYRATASSLDHLDGLSVELPAYWFNVRKSNTEPLLRLNLEAVSSDQLALALEELGATIAAAGGRPG